MGLFFKDRVGVVSLPDGGTSVREYAKVAIDAVSEREYGYAPPKYA